MSVIEAVRAGAFWHVLTEEGSWLLFDEHGARVRPSEEPGVVARVIALGEAAFLLRFDATVVRSAGADVESWSLPAPVLAAAAVDHRLVIGTVAGAIEIRDQDGAVVASGSATEPIAEIAAVPGYGFVVLGLHGGLWRARWPAAVLDLDPLRGSFRDRVFGLFPTAKPYAVGVVTVSGMGWLDVGKGSLRASAPGIECSARSVVELERGARAAVLGDDGELAIVETSTGRSSRLHGNFDKGHPMGVCAAGDEGLLAWTRSGVLFDISPTLAVRKIADDGVALARYAGAQEVAVFRRNGAMSRVTRR